MSHTLPLKIKYKRTPRVTELEIIKGIGVFFMIVLHVFVWWYIYDDQGSSITEKEFEQSALFLKLISLFSIILPITAGFALFYNLSRFKTGFNKDKFNEVLKRSFYLLLLGYATNILVYGLDDVISWDVLQFIALSFIVLFVFSFFHAYYLFIFSIMVVFITPFLRKLIENTAADYLTVILVGDSNGFNYWPFFPWFAFPAFGFLIAYAYNSGFFKNKVFVNSFWWISLAALTVSISMDEFLVKENVSNFWGPSIYMPPISRVFANIAVFNIFFMLLLRHAPVRLPEYGVINSFSKGILWIFISHLFIGFHLINLLKSVGLIGIRFVFLAVFLMMAVSYLVGIIFVRLRVKIKG